LSAAFHGYGFEALRFAAHAVCDRGGSLAGDGVAQRPRLLE